MLKVPLSMLATSSRSLISRSIRRAARWII